MYVYSLSSRKCLYGVSPLLEIFFAFASILTECSFLSLCLFLSLQVAVQVGLLGVMFYYTYMKQYVKSTGVSSAEQSPWTAAFLLASTLSSTDPVAVLSVLNAVNASDKLCTMFDGRQHSLQGHPSLSNLSSALCDLSLSGLSVE